MSASDAAPLPRLGEVYFDVRGEARSLRLSWYADTEVAVFSIWQGGTCTGTFRLPMADLPRMIDALQRGPQTGAGEAGAPQDDPRATELHGMPGQPGRTGHGPGQYGAGDYGSGDHGRTERHDVPPRGLGPEPDTGYSDPGLVAAASSAEGHGHAGAHARYEETRAVYPDEGLPGARGGYREDSYGDEPPTSVYRGGPLSQDRHGRHEDGPQPAGYRADPLDDPLPSGYRDDKLPGGYRGDRHGGGSHDALPGGYGNDSLLGGYRDEPRGPYRADSLAGGYRADLHGGHRDDPLSGSYRDEPRSGRRPADLGGSDYPEHPLTAGYPEERHTGGYPEDSHGGYAEEPMTARYRAEPPAGDYPTGPSDSAVDEPGYPASDDNAGYLPARPYVASVPDGPREAGEGRERGRRRGGGEESDPSADSFRYGRPPAEPEVRGRGR